MSQSSQTTTKITASAPGGDISTLTWFPCEFATGVRLGAQCNEGDQTIDCRLVFKDINGSYVGVSTSVRFTSDTTALNGALFLGTPNPDSWFPICGPSAFAVHVDSLSGGTWTLTPISQ